MVQYMWEVEARLFSKTKKNDLFRDFGHRWPYLQAVLDSRNCFSKLDSSSKPYRLFPIAYA